MTETCGIVSKENCREGTRFSGSTGTLVPGIEAQIINVETMKPLPPNQLGEICLKGPNLMPGTVSSPWMFLMEIPLTFVNLEVIAN